MNDGTESIVIKSEESLKYFKRVDEHNNLLCKHGWAGGWATLVENIENTCCFIDRRHVFQFPTCFCSCPVKLVSLAKHCLILVCALTVLLKARSRPRLSIVCKFVREIRGGFASRCYRASARWSGRGHCRRWILGAIADILFLAHISFLRVLIPLINMYSSAEHAYQLMVCANFTSTNRFLLSPVNYFGELTSLDFSFV